MPFFRHFLEIEAALVLTFPDFESESHSGSRLNGIGLKSPLILTL